MPRVIHFEINADDPDRAVQFYADVFGWTIKKWEGTEDYWLISSGEEDEPGIDGAIMKRMDPSAATINTVGVPSLDEFLEKVKEKGGNVITEKMTIPGVGFFAYCQDTEGNTFGIIQEDETAK